MTEGKIIIIPENRARDPPALQVFILRLRLYMEGWEGKGRVKEILAVALLTVLTMNGNVRSV